jgi:hypothetical protein
MPFTCAVTEPSCCRSSSLVNGTGSDLFQLDQARLGRSEAAFAHVEMFQVRFEVDMEPFASGSTGAVSGSIDEVGTNTVVPSVWVDRRVEEKGVGATVPADLDESDELLGIERADPGERVLL